MMLLLSGTLFAQGSFRVSPRAVDGTLDLRSWDFSRNGAVSLAGKWEFYWNQFVSPTMFSSSGSSEAELRRNGIRLTGMIDVPQSWTTGLHDRHLPAEGYATYHLRVLLPGSVGPMMLLVPNVRTSYTCFINGVRVLASGTIGTSRSTEIPVQTTKTEAFSPDRGEIDIVLHVANYFHRNAGITSSIRLGSERTLQYQREQRVNFDFLLIGAFLVMGLYQIGLFVLRSQDRTALYFGLFCLITVLRIYVTGAHERPPFHGLLSWEGIEKVDFTTLSVGFSVFLLYAHTLYRRQFTLAVRNAALIASGLYTGLILFTPNMVYGRILVVYQGIVLLTAGYLFWVLAVAIRRRRVGSVIFLSGYVVFFVGVLNDILVNNQLIGTPYIFPYALFIFIVFQAVLLARRFARIYRQVEYLTRLQDRLRMANDSLRELSYIDALTGAANRRHFDQFITEEWARAVRNNRSLSILMVDIDGFKPYNDNYGHQSGDEVLRKVSEALSSAIHRSVDFLCRYGGEEFVIVLPDTSQLGAARVAEKVRAAVEELKIPHEYSEVVPVVTISVGAASEQPRAGMDPEHLVDKADRALYRAKQLGKNRVATSWGSDHRP